MKSIFFAFCHDLKAICLEPTKSYHAIISLGDKIENNDNDNDIDPKLKIMVIVVITVL